MATTHSEIWRGLLNGMSGFAPAFASGNIGSPLYSNSLCSSQGVATMTLQSSSNYERIGRICVYCSCKTATANCDHCGAPERGTL